MPARLFLNAWTRSGRPVDPILLRLFLALVLRIPPHKLLFFFFFNDPATPEISPLPLHAPLPISSRRCGFRGSLSCENKRLTPPAPRAKNVAAWFFRLSGPAAAKPDPESRPLPDRDSGSGGDRKSTRLNSSHGYISYAVFCLKNKK